MEGILCGSPALARSWHPVARSTDLADGPVAVRLLGRPLVVWRDADGAAVAAPDRCPHREAPLSAGTVLDGCLQCPYHGWRFGGGGRCVLVPSSGAAVPPRAHLATVPTVERYGLVWTALGPPEGDVPVITEDADPAYRRLNPAVQTWRVSATRMVDNFLDVTHFPFVHRGTFGSAQDPQAPRVELEDLGDGWHGYRYAVTADNQRGGEVVSGQDSPVVHRAMSTGFVLPFAVRSTIRYDTGLHHVLLLASTPIDDVTSSFTFVVWRNDDATVPAEDVLRFDLAIGAEDQAMLERIAGVLPIEPTALVNVQGDRCSVEWRRRLALMLAGA